MDSHAGLSLFLDAIDEAYDRKSWHGPNLRGALRGLTPQLAFWRPAPARHNIYELVLHCAYWKYVVWRRLSGTRRGLFPIKGSNFFPTPPGAARLDLQLALDLLATQHVWLRARVAELAPARLDDPSVRHLLRGAAAHDLYHAGQIQLLKRLHSGPL